MEQDPVRKARALEGLRNLMDVLVEGCDRRWSLNADGTGDPFAERVGCGAREMLLGAQRERAAPPQARPTPTDSTPSTPAALPSSATSLHSACSASLSDEAAPQSCGLPPVPVPSAAAVRLSNYRRQREVCRGERACDAPQKQPESTLEQERDQAMQQFEEVVALYQDAEGRAKAAEEEKRVLTARLRKHEQQAAKRQRQSAVMEDELQRLQAELSAAKTLASPAAAPAVPSAAGCCPTCGQQADGREPATALLRAEAEINDLMAQNVSLLKQLEAFVAAAPEGPAGSVADIEL